MGRDSRPLMARDSRPYMARGGCPHIRCPYVMRGGWMGLRVRGYWEVDGAQVLGLYVCCRHFGGVRVWFHRDWFRFRRRVGVVGDFADHSVFPGVEEDVAGVFHGDVEGAEDQFGALEFHGAADQGVDDFHDGGLDGFRAFEQGDVVQARVGDGDGADHALVEVAETLSAESGGLAAESVDLDMSAGFGVGHKLVGPLDYFLVVSG